MDARDKARKEGVGVELGYEIVDGELQLGEEHGGCTLAVLRIRNEVRKPHHVVAGEDHEAYRVDLDDDGVFLATGCGQVGRCLHGKKLPRRVAEVEETHGVEVDIFENPVALDELGSLGTAIGMGYQLPEGSLDVEIGISEGGIHFGEYEPALEIAGGTLDVMTDELFGFKLGGYKGMIGVEHKVEVLVCRHGYSILRPLGGRVQR